MPVPHDERNFWLEIDSNGDGMHDTACGPSDPDGIVQLNVHMRDHGKIRKALVIYTFMEEDKLNLWVTNEHGQVVHKVETER